MKRSVQLNKLLYSGSQHDESNNGFEESYDQQIQEKENILIDGWRSNQNLQDQFITVNGPSVELPHNLSQNSSLFSMIASHRHDEDSRQERRYGKILQDKRREQNQFNQVLQKELNVLKQQLEKSRFQVQKYQGITKGLEAKVRNKEQQIDKISAEMQDLQEELAKLKEEKNKTLMMLAKKDECFQAWQRQSKETLAQLQQKQTQITTYKQQIKALEGEVRRLHQALSIYGEPDHRLLDFRSNDMFSSRKSAEAMQKIKRQKNNLQQELGHTKLQIQEIEAKFRQMEEQTKKKVTLKQRKILQLQQRLVQSRDDLMKNKANYDASNDKHAQNIHAKNKQVSNLTQKVNESEKRIKSLLDDTRKKDQKIRDINLQLIEKTKLANSLQKTIQELKTQQDFDHQMCEDKDRQIDKLHNQRKNLLQQLQSQKNEKLEKWDKIQKGERNDKLKMEKIRKQFETLKKQAQQLQKQKQEQANLARENKKKLEEATKRLQQSKTTCSQLQEELAKQNRQLQDELSKQTRNLEQKEVLLESQRKVTDAMAVELKDANKRAESIPQLRNKIIIMESRLKQNQNLMRQSTNDLNSSNLQDKLEALQIHLQEKQNQIKGLKMKLVSGSSAHSQQQQSEYYQMELEERDQLIAQLQQKLDNKDRIIDRLEREVKFKESTIQYTHKVLVSNEKQKIELEQQKKVLQEMVHRQSDDNRADQHQQAIDYYQETIDNLQATIREQKQRMAVLERKLREKQADRGRQQYVFENRQLKQRIKQLNSNILSKNQKFTPQTMSQEQTINFLVKTMKKVIRSTQMCRFLSNNGEFRQIFARMDRQLRR